MCLSMCQRGWEDDERKRRENVLSHRGALLNLSAQKVSKAAVDTCAVNMTSGMNSETRSATVDDYDDDDVNARRS